MEVCLLVSAYYVDLPSYFCRLCSTLEAIRGRVYQEMFGQERVCVHAFDIWGKFTKSLKRWAEERALHQIP